VVIETRFYLHIPLLFALLCLPHCAIAKGDTGRLADRMATEMIIIGTLHERHNDNPRYSQEVLSQVLLDLNPDAILLEALPEWINENGRVLPSCIFPVSGVENAVCDKVAGQLGIPIVPIDRTDRDENYRKTRYFERQNAWSKQINDLRQHLRDKHSDSPDRQLFDLFFEAISAQRKTERNGASQIINSDAYDQVIRTKHTIGYKLMQDIARNHEGYEAIADFSEFARADWQERNEIMRDKILEAALDRRGERCVVVTGAEHRYVLRDLLADQEDIMLREYWEILAE
jgi:hypothetical protein